MDEPTKHENRTYRLTIITLVVNVVVSLLTALIGAGFLVSKSEVKVQASTTELIDPNRPYTAQKDGFVIIEASANPSRRSVGVFLEVDGRRLGATGAQDASVPGVPSIFETTITIPVKKGSVWKVVPRSSDYSAEGVKATYVSFERDVWAFLR